MPLDKAVRQTGSDHLQGLCNDLPLELLHINVVRVDAAAGDHEQCEGEGWCFHFALPVSVWLEARYGWRPWRPLLLPYLAQINPRQRRCLAYSRQSFVILVCMKTPLGGVAGGLLASPECEVS